MTLNEKIAEIEELRGQLLTLTKETIRDTQEAAEAGLLEETAPELVDLLEVLKWTKSDIRDLDNESNETLVTIMDNMNTRKFQRGSFLVEKKISNYRTNWQNDVLLRSVINTCLDEIEPRSYVDQESGELINERQIVAPWMDAVIDRLLACAAFRDWRVTALRSHIPGLNPDNLCDVKRSVKAVISRKVH